MTGELGRYVRGTSGGHEPKQMPAGSVVVLFPSVGIYFCRGGERKRVSRGIQGHTTQPLLSTHGGVTVPLEKKTIGLSQIKHVFAKYQIPILFLFTRNLNDIASCLRMPELFLWHIYDPIF